MKTAFVCPSFYPHIGGVETVILQLAFHMAAKGIDVTVLTQTNDISLVQKEQLNNFTIRRFYEFGFREIKMSFGLFHYLQKSSGTYDVIHMHNYHSFPALCAALAKKGPLVFSPHYHGTGHSTFTHLLHYPYRYIGKFIFSKSDAVLCASDAEAKLVQRHFPRVKKITVVPLGIDVEGIQKAKKYKDIPPYILAIGRLEGYKNIKLIIRSLPFINSRVGLKIVGDGPEKQELRDIVQKLDLSDRITFLKNVSKEDLHRLLKTAKVFVTMSRMEAYGLSLLEAAAAETGIVASDIPAHKDLITRFKINNVLLLNPDSSPRNLANSIMITMNKPSKTEKKLPSWELVTEQTLQVYREIIARN